MNMKKLALAAAVAALSTGAFAAQELVIDTGLATLVNDLANNLAYEGTFQNLSVNNSDLIEAAVSLTTGSGVLSDAVVATTGIGAVQSGNVDLVVSTVSSDSFIDTSTTTNTTNNSVTDLSSAASTTTANLTDVSTTTTDIVTDKSNAAASTSSTATSQIIDQSTDASSTATDITAVNETTNNIDADVLTVSGSVNDTANDIDDVVTGATTSAFGVVNVAYNNATIDASVDMIDNSVGGIVGVQLGEQGSITTTAIGAVQSGSITVTVQ